MLVSVLTIQDRKTAAKFTGWTAFRGARSIATDFCRAESLMLAASNLSYERYLEPVFRPLSFRLDAGQLIVVRGPERLRQDDPDSNSGRNSAALDGPPRAQGGAASAGRGIRRDSRKTSACSKTHDLPTGCAAGAGAISDLRAVLERLDIVGCAEQTVRSLSAGQKKRTALARLLLVRAGLWLLDEPYSNLDTSGISILDALLVEHLQAGGACVLATHGSHQPPGAKGTGVVDGSG